MVPRVKLDQEGFHLSCRQHLRQEKNQDHRQEEITTKTVELIVRSEL